MVKEAEEPTSMCLFRLFFHQLRQSFKDLKTQVCLLYLLDQGVSTGSDMSGEVCGGEVPKTVGTVTPDTPVYSPWGRLGHVD